MRIMCMGDSITYGSKLPELSGRWSDLVAASTGHTLVNLGIGGDTTGGMLARCQTQVFAKESDVLHILGGTNDICYTYDYHQAFANILSMVRHAKAFGVPALVGIPIPFVQERFVKQGWSADRDNGHISAQCEKLALALQDYCANRDIPIVDYRSIFCREDGTVRTELYVDALHPNAAGHRAMAELLCKRLEEIFPVK